VQLPLTVPTLEDKVLQRAVVMLLEPIYEQDFDVGSYGFRPGRSAHDALEDLWKRTMDSSGGWILEVDIRKFFDTLDHAHRREFLHLRVRDGVLKRLIGKWLKAGVMESGSVSYPEAGSPQGGVITPQTILQNFRFCFRLPCREPGFGLSMDLGFVYLYAFHQCADYFTSC
jgi:retron-type reverse transcriptase